MVKLGFNRNFNIGRVVSKVTVTVIALWVGGVIITEIGNVMINTSSPFYRGLTLIGWTVGTTSNATSYSSCGIDSCTQCTDNLTTGLTINNCITDTSGAGVLAVVGIIGIASIVLEFVQIKMG